MRYTTGDLRTNEPINTPLGRFKDVRRDGEIVTLFECPGCGDWATLDDDQWHGRVSVDHTGGGQMGQCGYHETHDYYHALTMDRLR